MDIINNNSSGGGIGFAGLLTIVFIVLKLLGKIDLMMIVLLMVIMILLLMMLNQP